jgi:hypothetical protein
MSSTPDDAGEEVIDRFLTQRGMDDPVRWEESYNKKQCPECGGLAEETATACAVCGWAPE